MSRVFLSLTRKCLLGSILKTSIRSIHFPKIVLNSNVKPMRYRIDSKPLNIIIRKYSHVPLTLESVSDRVMLNLKCFDKIDPEKVTLDSNLMKDMGIDSLDHVEVIMAVEEEFGKIFIFMNECADWLIEYSAFEIPDQEAVKLNTPREIIQYVCDKFDVFE